MAEKTKVDKSKEAEARRVLGNLANKIDQVLGNISTKEKVEGKLNAISDSDFTNPQPFKNESVEFERYKGGVADNVGFSVPEEQASELISKLAKELESNEEIKGKIWTEEMNWKVYFMVKKEEESVGALLKIFESDLPFEVVKNLKRSVETK
jgi:hypothetical protein